MWQQLIHNQMLITALAAWFLSGLLKLPIEYIITKKWNLGLFFAPGGMPSAHSALVTATMLSVGLYDGFNTAAFVIAFTLMMVVLYDAAGVRRQAGYHAEKINAIINALLAGDPISGEELNEVLGHTPREVIAGVFTGALIAISIWLFWH
jgi:acid phosphatase family membrane protein YuiD